ncbi:AglZ/HisF2 family acetamidino modification protein [Bacteroidota bacterium]
MIRPRIIPCLLIKDGGLVKTVQFENPKYVGDPINAVRIFNEKLVDELIVLDLDATVKNKNPDLKTIENLATECCMPLCYGGGIKTVEQICRIIELGVEKVSLSSAAIDNPELVCKGAELVGNQSIVVTLDVKKTRKGYRVFTHNGRKNTKLDPVALVKDFQESGAGEIVINSIDKDGIMKGYDLNLIEKIMDVIKIPITLVGGAGSLKDIGNLFEKFGLVGVCAGSLFVFKGVYRAVLINYPNVAEKELLYSNYFNRDIDY